MLWHGIAAKLLGMMLKGLKRMYVQLVDVIFVVRDS